MNGLCGCCRPAAPLTPLAINNRPGLSAVACRIGTYASFREAMLDAIASTPELAHLGVRSDDDYSITLLDLWAAVADVLTFYQERYANEVYLRTAQQPQSLQRLAGLLGYDPRPGVAALAELAFTADQGKIIHVPVGLRVQSAPAQSQQPQTFETLETATVDWRLNSLRIFPQPIVINPLAAGSTEITLDRMSGPAMAAALAVNDTLVLFNDAGNAPPEEKKIAAIRTEDDRVIIQWSTPVTGTKWNASTKIWKIGRKFRLFGYNAPATFMKPAADPTVPGGIGWTFSTLGPADFAYPRINELNIFFKDLLYLDTRYTDLPPNMMVLAADSVGTAFATAIGVDEGADTLGSVSDTVSRILLDTEVSFADRRSAVVYELLGHQVAFWPAKYAPTMVSSTFYLPGRCVRDAQGVGVEVGRTIQQNAFVPGVVIYLPDIEIGRKFLLLDANNSPVKGTQHSSAQLDAPGAPAGSFVHLVIPVDADSISLQTASARLSGNVVSASHGETVSNEVLGSGDASQAFQNFTFQKQPLTYVPGSGPDGVVSSLSVRVNGLLWQEVPGLYEQPANAQAYSTSTAEDGRRVVQFGDGRIGGAVLPTGAANITALYRVGSGLAGRVAANALTTLLDRLQGLSSVTNPLSAEGGADPETPATVRSSAPRTVRTFGRAVSLKDFEDLITASGEVAKAEAIWVWEDLAPAIYLTVAGQAGGTFSDLGSLAATLDNARDTNHRLLMGNYQNVPIQISAKILALPQFVRDDVLNAARSALLDALAFDNLNLGQSIHLSFVYTILQDVPGVLAADITLFAFRKPDGMTAAQFAAYLDSRAVERLSDGSVNPVQGHLRIFSARTDPSVAGRVLPGELAVIQDPSADISISAQKS